MNKTAIFMATIFVFGQVACTSYFGKAKKKASENKTIEVNAKEIGEDSTLTKAEKAEKLALAAEQMVTPGSFFYADEVFAEALKYDANNKRALFYKAILKPKILLKGVYSRIEPMMAKDPENYQGYEDLKNNYEVGMRTFLLDGPKDIDSEEKAQLLLDDVQAAWDEARVFMKNHKDLDLNLNLPEVYWQEQVNYRGDICTVEKMGELVFVQSCTTDFQVLKATVERADIEALQHAAAGMQIYLIAGTTYDASGAQVLNIKFRDQNYTEQEFFEEAKLNEQFGVLRSEQQLKKLIAIGNDFVAGMRWAQNMQANLCGPVTHVARSPKNPENSREIRRKGKLFDQGICIAESQPGEESLKNILNKIEVALAGNIMSAVHEETKTSTMIKYTALVENPVKDLKELPRTFNDCGNLASLTDDSLGGAFVNNDATEYLTKIGDLNRNAGECDGNVQ